MKSFENRGYALIEDVIEGDELAPIERTLDECHAAGAAGTRTLLAQGWCRSLASRLKTHAKIAPLLPDDAVAVQCTFFEKNAQRNWLVALHQDLSVPVQERIDHPALHGWSHKEGSLFVQPPAELLEQVVAIRLHIDDCGGEHGPVRVVPQSHRSGRLDEAQMLALREAIGEKDCTISRGGVLAMRPLLLHASSKATNPNRRRVLHFLYAPARPPYGLQWKHAV